MAKSKKEKVVNTLVSNTTTMYHSNRITNSFISEMTGVGMQIFIEIIKTLQQEIKSSKDNTKQLELFLSPGYINLKIAYKEITDRRRYYEVAEALESLRVISVNMQSVEHKNYVKFTGLISAYEILEPIKEGTPKYFYVRLDRDVATYLISIDQSHKGGMFYTKWLYEVSKKASNVYTVRLYWLVCSWLKKGYFDISYDNLRKILGVPNDAYPNFGDFKRRVLEASNKQLEKIADCWLNLNIKYEIKEGAKVVGFKFKVEKLQDIEQSKEQIKLQMASIDNLLIRAFHFTSKDILTLHELIDEYNIQYDVLIEKIIYLDEHIKQKSIKNKAAFAMKSIRNEFC